MKHVKRVAIAAFAAALAVTGAMPTAWAGAQHNEFQFQTLDWNDCTEEEVAWDVLIREVVLGKETPSGQGMFMDQWFWDGTVEGLTTGYIWTSKGQAPYVERYSLNNSLTGGFFAIENSILQPVTPGAPRIMLDVMFRLVFNAQSDLVVDQASYTYDCR